MQKVLKNNIPIFLRDSELYKQLFINEGNDSDSETDYEIDDNYVKIPKQYIIAQEEIETIKDNKHLIKLCKKLRYWMVNKLPFSIYTYIINNVKFNFFPTNKRSCTKFQTKFNNNSSIDKLLNLDEIKQSDFYQELIDLI